MPPLQQPPFFLIGVQRTGSTLLRLMLNHHPEVACLHAFTSNILREEKEGGPPNEPALRKRLQQDRQYRNEGVEAEPGLDYHQQLERIYRIWCERFGQGRSVLGVTLHFRYLLAKEIWPEAKFIHLVRDPRDVAQSFINLGWAGNPWHATSHWVKAEREVEALRGVLPEGRILTVRFEDLVHHPQRELERICAHLGVTYDPAMLRYPETTTYKLPDPSIAERWRRKMDPRDVQLIEARAGEMLESRGYLPSGHARLRIEGVVRLRLEMQNRVAKLRYRIDKYGARPVLVNALASRLGMEKTRLRQVEKMQAIDLEHLV